MPTVVSTGQITIVDNNDARPITAFITAPQMQQVYNPDSNPQYSPDWTSAALTLTAKVYVGGTTSATDVTSQLSNKKWSNDLSASIGSATTLTVNTNLTVEAPLKVYYFEGDYTDPVTGLVSHIIAQITLSLVRTGTNAVFIQVSGQNAIEESTSGTKNTVVLKADLIRASGVDATVTKYKWFQSPHGNADQIDANLSGVATKYGFRTTAQTTAGSGGGLNQNLPADGTWADVKSIFISELAVHDIAVFKVSIEDSSNITYSAFFTVYDVSDPYDTTIVSTAGDKLQNGVGSTDMYPVVAYGSSKLTDLTGWTFDWQFYDRNGNRGGFVDTTRTALAGGRTVSSHTTGTSAVFTYSGSAITFAAGDVVKVVQTNGTAAFYEVASGTGNTVTIRTPVTNVWLNYAAPTTDQFTSGKLFVCKGGVTTNGGATATDAKITLTGDDVDVKATVVCASNRP